MCGTQTGQRPIQNIAFSSKAKSFVTSCREVLSGAFGRSFVTCYGAVDRLMPKDLEKLTEVPNRLRKLDDGEDGVVKPLYIVGAVLNHTEVAGLRTFMLFCCIWL